MACRRRHGGITRSATFNDDIFRPSQEEEEGDSISSSASQSLAAQAIRASAAHRESSAHAQSSFRDRSKGGPTYDYTSMSSTNEGGGFWGVLARKAKAILEDDTMSHQFEPRNMSSPRASKTSQYHQSFQNSDGSRKTESPAFQKGVDALTSSLNQIGGKMGTAFEERRTTVDNKTVVNNQEMGKLQIRRKVPNNLSEEDNQVSGGVCSPWQQIPPQPTQLQMHTTSPEDQLKASRDVAMATAAKAKLLLRELKTVKADLTFAKQRCSQLEEENKMLRDAREKGGNLADDDMIRHQLETLLAEKSRLANENAVYARENRFLREIVEYHQLTMQDVVYLDDEGAIDEVTEVYTPTTLGGVRGVFSSSPTSPASPRSLPDTISSSPVTNFPMMKRSSSVNKFPLPLSPQLTPDVPKLDPPPCFRAEGSKRQ
ncbi:unnamed protein product [Cuscuta europaea]|uniref:Uncharacterized protein n=1 Tax=Cuscuta europaea TaxID=41803 RepID=A0A9P1EF28_CUSEU|nr:unnamed protein product [Cuscuta europaea]